MLKNTLERMKERNIRIHDNIIEILFMVESKTTEKVEELIDDTWTLIEMQKFELKQLEVLNVFLDESNMAELRMCVAVCAIYELQLSKIKIGE